MARSGQSPKARRRSPCPTGTIRRKGYVRKAYTTKGGVHVKNTRIASSCIKKQGSTAPRQRASPLARRRVRNGARCPVGQIPRASYVRKSYIRNGKRVKQTRVQQGCIKDVGRKGRGAVQIEKKFKLRKGALTALGYNVDAPVAERRAALVKAWKNGVPLNSLIWKLGAVYAFRANRPKGSVEYKRGQRFRADQKFLTALRKKGAVRSPMAKRRYRKNSFAAAA